MGAFDNGSKVSWPDFLMKYKDSMALGREKKNGNALAKDKVIVWV